MSFSLSLDLHQQILHLSNIYTPAIVNNDEKQNAFTNTLNTMAQIITMKDNFLLFTETTKGAPQCGILFSSLYTSTSYIRAIQMAVCGPDAARRGTSSCPHDVLSMQESTIHNTLERRPNKDYQKTTTTITNLATFASSPPQNQRGYIA